MNEFTQKTAYSELAKKYYPEALESLVNFIKINSVNDESTVMISRLVKVYVMP